MINPADNVAPGASKDRAESPSYPISSSVATSLDKADMKMRSEVTSDYSVSKVPDTDESEPSSTGLRSTSFPRSTRGRSTGEQPIGELMHQALTYPHLISLAAGFVDESTLPVPIAIDSLQSMVSSPERMRKSLQYGSNQGDLELRQAILQFSYRDFPPLFPIEADQVLLTAGSNQLLHLVADSLFDPGDIVLTAAPTYFVYLGTLESMGVRVIGVESDSQGVCPEALQEVLTRLNQQGLGNRVKGIYLVPYFDNPASKTMDARRRIEIANVVMQWRSQGFDSLLLADYAYQELGFEPTAVPPWRSLVDQADDFTIEFGTFSKSLSPGIRVGWGVFPKPMVSMMKAMKANIDFGSPNFNQQWMLEILKQDQLRPHLEVLRSGYRTKSSAMVEACREHLGKIPDVRWQDPEGGLYVWIELPEQLPASTGSPLFQACIQKGVLYVPGEYCFPREGVSRRKNSLRLTFGVQSPERIRVGIQLLSEAIRSTLR